MGRPVCERCSRPQSACLCDELPREPVQTVTQVVVLQHPHEQRHKLSTAPFLPACLARCHLLVGRRFAPGLLPLLDALAETAAATRPHVLLLFPSPDAADLQQWNIVNSSSSGNRDVVLLLVDGTWKHAKEMIRASMPFLASFVIPVCFPHDVRKQGLGKGEELILRKEPYAGCISTLEAVARALAFLEPNGPEIQDKMLAVLRKMVDIQASYIPRRHH